MLIYNFTNIIGIQYHLVDFQQGSDPVHELAILQVFIGEITCYGKKSGDIIVG